MSAAGHSKTELAATEQRETHGGQGCWKRHSSNDRWQGRWPYLIVDLWEEKKGRFRNPNKNPKVSRSEQPSPGLCDALDGWGGEGEGKYSLQNPSSTTVDQL